MAATLAALLTAHLLGDFILQTDWMVGRKRRIWILVLHVVVVTSATYLLLGTFDWRILLAIFLTHFVMDAIKVYWLSDSLAPFLADQFVHLAVLAGLACCFPDAAKDGWWIAGMKPGLSKWYFASLCCVSGFILCVPAGGILIAKLIRRFTEEIRDNDLSGLRQGGQYIGWLERMLVMLLLLIDQPNGIGFLIAAKSILRFGEIKDASQRKVAEYIIIGTFLSFAWALLISVLTQRALKHWLP
jgi:Protein of unknown function (DUF3307)